MRHSRIIAAALVSALAGAAAAQGAKILTGKAALGGWRTDAPGVRRQLAAADMAAPKRRRTRGGHDPEQGRGHPRRRGDAQGPCRL